MDCYDVSEILKMGFVMNIGVYVGFMIGTPDAKQQEQIREATCSDI